MINRCTYPSVDSYMYYGGRGIKVCDRWKKFTNFLEDMGEPASDLSLDRIDPNGHYEPGNCRWIPKKRQMQNTRRNRFLEHKGQRHCVSEWARVLGMEEMTLTGRLRDGWSVEEALTFPVQKRRVYDDQAINSAAVEMSWIVAHSIFRLSQPPA
jgi:hypothetical protein